MNDEATKPLEDAHQAIAALVARQRGLGDPTTLNAADRAIVEQQTVAMIEGYGNDLAESAAGATTNIELRGLLAAYHALMQLRADNANVVLAEQGEVFAQEDDA